ncbi:type 1 glutamine amidotransferase domain-containing protein [Chitinimonas sp. JJ19]|uniref:type 1 glutamine amidotransferase domain-containing protein n=1 Tax=Chitinimonas sp. JJ19 TaxID=3109352 RepID=UPI001A5B8152|nr:DJ-1/PfpI family protein [Chitinimonas sp.]
MILCILPSLDYDPTESAVPWQALQQAGVQVRFATPTGAPAYADRRLTDTGFSIMSPVFMAKPTELAIYREMTQDPHFLAPLPYADVDPDAFDGLLIPGGHAPGVRSMLDSDEAKRITLGFFQTGKPIAAVCHGVLLPARTLDPATGKSVLHGRKSTGLPAFMELFAWFVTAPWLGRYYRTYPCSVATELKAALADPHDYTHGPVLPLRDSADNHHNGFVVEDGNYLSARWPGDCYRFAKRYSELVVQYQASRGRR